MSLTLSVPQILDKILTIAFSITRFLIKCLVIKIFINPEPLFILTLNLENMSNYNANVILPTWSLFGAIQSQDSGYMVHYFYFSICNSNNHFCLKEKKYWYQHDLWYLTTVNCISGITCIFVLKYQISIL